MAWITDATKEHACVNECPDTRQRLARILRTLEMEFWRKRQPPT